MNDRLHEILAQCSIIHQKNIDTGIIKDLDAIEETLSTQPEDVKEHYLKLLLQYYFQINYLEGVQALLLQGFKFDLRFDDIKEAFIHIDNGDENVIEFFEESIVMLKDTINDKDLLAIYNYYQDNKSYQPYLEEPLDYIRKNRYVCAHAYKVANDYVKFFLNGDLLDSLKRDMPFLLK